jgi:cytoskeleton protein RodZ
MESFGARLKRERQQRKIELDDISASTKISTRFLRALEEEQFDQLPGGIFNKGFVRAYAHHLGIDEAQAIVDYLAAVAASQPQPQPESSVELMPPAPKPEEENHPAAEIPWGALALALLVIAFGFAAWGFYSREESAKPARVVSSPVHDRKTPTASQDPAPAPSAPTPSPQPAATESIHPPAQEPGERPAASSAPPNTPAAPGRFVLLIKVREDSWLWIDADGKPLMNDLMVAPAEKAVEAEKEIVLRAGNMGALDISFNGKKLPSQGDYGEVKTLTFSADGLQPPAPKPATAPVLQ